MINEIMLLVTLLYITSIIWGIYVLYTIFNNKRDIEELQREIIVLRDKLGFAFKKFD